MSQRGSEERIAPMSIFLLSGMYKCTLVQSRGHCQRQHYSSSKPNPVLLKAPDSILNALQSMHLQSFSELGQ